jgi:hypothetical protein
VVVKVVAMDGDEETAGVEAFAVVALDEDETGGGSR